MNTLTHYRQLFLILVVAMGAAFMPQSHDTTVPAQANQPDNLSPLLWNKLGSDYEVTHSEIGPNGTILGTAYAFEPAKFGNGYVRKDVGNNYVSFPGSIFDALTETRFDRAMGQPQSIRTCTLSVWGFCAGRYALWPFWHSG